MSVFAGAATLGRRCGARDRHLDAGTATRCAVACVKAAVASRNALDLCDCTRCAPQVVAPTNACKVRSSSSDPLSVLALLARPRRSTSWRRSTAAGGSFMEHCVCAALQHRRCHTGSQLLLCRPGYARAAVQCGHDSVECARSCVESGCLRSTRLTHPCTVDQT